MTQSQDTSLAVVGVGCLFPEAGNLAEYWANIKNGRDAIKPIPATHWKPENYFNADPKKPDHTYGQRGGFLKPYAFNPIEFGIAPNDIEATDTSQLLGMVVAHEALKDAGYGTDRNFDRERVGCIMGVTGTLELVIPLGARLGHPIWREALKDAGVPNDVADDVVQRIADSYVGWQENSFPGLLGNVVAGRIAQRLNLGGTNCVIDAACASSLSALHLACLELTTGRADMMVTGGVDTFNDIFMYMCFSKTPALSATGNARPFDRDGDGTVLGEGVGAVILKRLADAERDGDQIYAVIKGVGTSSDGKGQAIYAPNSKGQAKALRRAYDLAGVKPRQIDLVEAHGTGTKVGDAVELKALTEVYGEGGSQDTWVTLGSVKSQIGHAKSAAGVAGVIKAVMALHHKVLPPTIKMENPLEIMKESPFFCSPLARPWVKANGDKRIAAVSAFGFGGSNFHCVIEEYGATRTKIAGDQETWILPFAANDAAGIEAAVQEALKKATSPQKLRGLARTLSQAFSAKATCRLVLVCEASVDGAKAQLTKALQKLSEQKGAAHWSASADGIYFSSQAAQGSLACVFPGQGSQYVGMMRDMAVSHPAWLETLTVASRVKSTTTTADELAERIYPRDAHVATQVATREAELRATQVAQPAIGAMSAASWLALKEFGIAPKMVAGHSFGELTALFAAGAFDLNGFATLAQARGDVMASLSGDLGTMMAVIGKRDEIEKILKSAKVDVVIANHNSPKQVVLSGSQAGIEHAAKVLGEAKITSKRINVGAAFHSPLVAPAAIPFASSVGKVAWSEPTCVVYSNTTAKPYPETLKGKQSTLSKQLAHGVAFVEQIEAMYADGARTFIEVGPGAVLTGLIKAILADRTDVNCIALDSSAGKRTGFVDMARVLAELAAIGHDVQLAKWDQSFVAGRDDQEPVPFAIALTGANYRKPWKKRPPVAERTMTVPGISAPAVPSAPRAVVPVNPVAPVAARAAAPSPKTEIPTSAPKAVEAPRVATSKPIVTDPVQHKVKEKTMEPSLNQVHTTQALAVQPQVIAPAPTQVIMSAPANLNFVQESFLALQRMSQENAALHRQFLENQAASQAMFHRLLVDQQALLSGAPQSAPVYHAPTYAAPTYAAPAPAAQAYAAPATRTIPAAPQPTYQAPLQQPTRAVEPTRVVAQPAPAPVAPKVEVRSAPQTVVAKAPAAVAPASVAAPASNKVSQVLISIIADKTGYPESMLEMSMSLEGDLGIDSIKRVEIFAALQEAIPESGAIKPDELGQLRTLGDIVARVSPASSQVATEPARVGATTAAPATPTPTPTPTSNNAGNYDQYLTTLKQIVADKTGYPVDMLHAEMALESDLGIDSIKRVEIFAELQERVPQAGKIGSDQVSTLATLAAIAQYLAAGSEGAATVATSVAAPVVAASHADAASDITAVVLATVSEKTGYPADMLNADMELESDLGIDSIKRVEIFAAFQERWPAQAGADASVLNSLKTIRQIVAHFGAASGSAIETGNDVSAGGAGAKKKTLELPTCQPELTIERFEVAPVLISDGAPQITKPFAADDHVWIVAGHKDLGKSIAKELKSQSVTATVLTMEQAVERAVPETLHGLLFLTPDRGTTSSQEAFVLNAFKTLQRTAASLQRAGKETHAHLASVTYLDGAFGLAGHGEKERAYGAGIAGLIKSAGHEWPEVNAKTLDVAPTWLEEAAKAAAVIVGEWQSQGAREVAVNAAGERRHLVLKKTPVMTRDAHAAVPQVGDVFVVSGGARGVTASVALALAEAWQPTIVILGRSDVPEKDPQWAVGQTTRAELQKALLASGGKWTPKSASDAISRVLQDREVRDNIQGLRNAGAQVIYCSVDIRDTAAVAATLKDIRAKYGPVRGLVHGAGVLADKLIVDKTVDQFQSVYSTKIRGLEALMEAIEPNELRFCVLFSSSTGRFGRKGQCDYAVANEVLNKLADYYGHTLPQCRTIAVNWGPWDGGMVTPELKKLFASEGIAVIPIRDGAHYVTAELCRGPGAANEIVILGKPEEEVTQKLLQSQTLSIKTAPVLKAHVINGNAVVPAALLMEFVAQAALQSQPGLKVASISEFKVLKGIVLAPDESIVLEAFGGGLTLVDGEYEMTVALTSAGASNRVVRHASARIRLSDRFVAREKSEVTSGANAYPLSVAAAYDSELFHGPELHGIVSVDGIDKNHISATVKAAPQPASWLTDPARGRWVADPLAIDSAFQLMILWSRQFKQAPALPCAVGFYEQFQESLGSEPLTLRAEITEEHATKIKATIEFLDTKNQLVARLEGYEGIIDAGLNQRFRNNEISATVH